jgi:hypothetical protein
VPLSPLLETTPQPPLRGAVLLRPQPAPAEPPEPEPAVAPLLPAVLLLVLAGGAVATVWAASLWLSLHVEADATLHTVALFAHLVALTAGFGAVLVVDWCGLLWLLGRRRLEDVVDLARTCHAVIWAGLAALTLSGSLLHPDLGALRTQVKLGVVLVLALNGVQAVLLQRRLEAVSGAPARRLLLRVAASAGLSQAGWWTATAIGFLTHQAR